MRWTGSQVQEENIELQSMESWWKEPGSFPTPYIDTHTNTHMHTLALFILSVQLHLKKLFEKTLYAKGIAIAVPCLEYTQSRISGEDTWWQ